MAKSQPSNIIRVYTEEFYFAEAKKYLKIKGPLAMEIVHDHMYPLLRYGMKVTIARPENQEIRVGQLACFWQEGMIRPCLITEVDGNQNFKVSFLNSDELLGKIPFKYFLGEIIHPKWPWWARLKYRFFNSKKQR